MRPVEARPLSRFAPKPTSVRPCTGSWKSRVGGALENLSKRIGFRLAPGLSERVIYRELFPAGLTLLDLTGMARTLNARTYVNMEFFFTAAVFYLVITFVLINPDFLDAKGALLGGNNMAAIHLANAVGGNVFLGFISAVAFATILAVVAGLALSGASAVSHDLYACVMRKGQASEQQEMRVSRIATLCIGVLAIILGLLFESQNIAFLSGLVLAVAASVNFPVLLLSMFWKGLTTRGAVCGSMAGLVSAVLLVVLGPAVWVNVLHNETALFPYSNPALFSMSLAFLSAWVFSVTDTSERAVEERGRYLGQFIRSMTGIGAAGASKH